MYSILSMWLEIPFHSRSNIVIGHTIANDLRCLRITSEDLNFDVVRDVQKHYKGRCHDQDFKDRGFQLPPLKHPSNEYSLKTLAWHLLHEEVQKGDHSAIEDAQTTMKLYLLDQFKFEEHVRLREMEWWAE